MEIQTSTPQVPGTKTTIHILAENLQFPEGPAFDGAQNLWGVELRGGGLIRWKNGVMERIATGGRPNGIAIDRDGRIFFCDSGLNAIRRYSPATGAIEVIASQVDGEPLFMPNDLAFDSFGNLLFTCPGDSRREPAGYVCVLTPGGEVRKIARNLYFPNGLAFGADGETLVIAETYRQQLWKGRWDPAAATLTGEKVWAAELGGAPGPDGMALAADGTMYVAVYGSGSVKAVDAAGKIVGAYELPGANPTNCAFDPDGSLGLVVTESERGLLLSLPELGPGTSLFAP